MQAHAYINLESERSSILQDVKKSTKSPTRFEKKSSVHDLLGEVKLYAKHRRSTSSLSSGCTRTKRTTSTLNSTNASFRVTKTINMTNFMQDTLIREIDKLMHAKKLIQEKIGG